MGQFFRNICASIAQFEGKLIYERLSKGSRRKAEKGGYTGGWLPYGYCLEAGRAIVEPREAAVVRRVFRWLAEGLSLRWIATRLNAGGARTRRGGAWQPSTVRRMLGDRLYAGQVNLDEGPVRAQHDAVVPDDLYLACVGNRP